MRYKVHYCNIDMENERGKLEAFLNDLKGEVVSIIPKIRRTTLFQIYGITKKIDFLMIVEKVL